MESITRHEFDASEDTVTPGLGRMCDACGLGESNPVHRLCSECGLLIEDDCQCKARVVRVTYNGSPGSYYDQPEPAEGLIWCPICQDTEDGSFDSTMAYCYTCRKDHDLEPIGEEL
jgi:hypothetical protein